MRKYSMTDLEILKNNIKVINNNDVEIILKPSPGEDREGFLDLYEKAILDENLKENKNDSLEGLSFEEVIQKIRDSMGFANYNLNTVEIYTKFEILKDSGNEVGLWRYYPRHLEREKNLKALVFFHGGGWIGGSTYVVENFCKLIAERANCVVFNVDYSLAPEKPYPNGFNDNYLAVKHIYENSEKYNIDKSKISISGDSAGGNYAATVSLKARDENIPMVAMQVLIYPCVLLGNNTVPGYEWREEMIKIAPELESLLRPFTYLGKPIDLENDPIKSNYLLDQSLAEDSYVSPMLAKTHRGLPKSILVSAEFDGLRIQTEFYAKLLKESGVDTTCYRYKGTTHAFIDKLGFVPQAEDLVNVISEAIINL